MSQHFPAWMGPQPRANAPWTPEEETELKRGYQEFGLNIRQLCEKHGRGVGGVESRLAKIIPGFLDQQFHDQENLEEKLLDLKKEMVLVTQKVPDLMKKFELFEEQLRQRGCRLGR